jgi:hypothetical protein
MTKDQDATLNALPSTTGCSLSNESWSGSRVTLGLLEGGREMTVVKVFTMADVRRKQRAKKKLERRLAGIVHSPYCFRQLNGNGFCRPRDEVNRLRDSG